MFEGISMLRGKEYCGIASGPKYVTDETTGITSKRISLCREQADRYFQKHGSTTRLFDPKSREDDLPAIEAAKFFEGKGPSLMPEGLTGMDTLPFH